MGEKVVQGTMGAYNKRSNQPRRLRKASWK